MKSRKKPFFNGNRPPNTFIGGVGASIITNTTQLAAKLSIQSYHIKNFKIDTNNNVSCYIGRNYTMNASAFVNNNNITYYFDLDGKCTYLNTQAFHNVTNSTVHQIIIFPNVTGCNAALVSGGGAGTRGKINIACLPKLEPIGVSGTTSQNNFSWCDFFGNVYVNSANQTNNAGSPDADISSAISSNIGTWIRYSSNSDSPSGATGIYTVSATTSSIHIGWNAVSHSNAIDYYALFRDGVFVSANNTTSRNVTGLTSGTTYEFKVLVIDEMGNSSKKFSNVYSGTTLT